MGPHVHPACSSRLSWSGSAAPCIGIGATHPLDTEIRPPARDRRAVRGLAGLESAADHSRSTAAKRNSPPASPRRPTPSKKSGSASPPKRSRVVADRLREAMTTLKKSKLGGVEEAAGPAALVHVHRPARRRQDHRAAQLRPEIPARRQGKARPPLRGVGGTRNCDWWFTDEAVLIDTAGRYTTQDSQAEVDKAGWLGFLKLLKKHRRRQPLNGVLVAISLSDLSLLSDEERQRPCQSDPPPGSRAAGRFGRAPAGLRAVHQGRPDRRLRRVLRQHGQGGARAGLGRHLRRSTTARARTAPSPSSARSSTCCSPA